MGDASLPAHGQNVAIHITQTLSYRNSREKIEKNRNVMRKNWQMLRNGVSDQMPDSEMLPRNSDSHGHHSMPHVW